MKQSQGNVRDRILQLHEDVQQVIKIRMASHAVMEAPDATPEELAEEALGWWTEMTRKMAGRLGDDAALARHVVAEARKQEVWGKILREGTQ